MLRDAPFGRVGCALTGVERPSKGGSSVHDLSETIFVAGLTASAMVKALDMNEDDPNILDPAAMLSVAERLRAYAQQIRVKPTAGLDVDVLERASTYLEQAASELEAMRSEC